MLARFSSDLLKLNISHWVTLPFENIVADVNIYLQDLIFDKFHFYFVWGSQEFIFIYIEVHKISFLLIWDPQDSIFIYIEVHKILFLLI